MKALRLEEATGIDAAAIADVPDGTVGPGEIGSLSRRRRSTTASCGSRRALTPA